MARTAVIDNKAIQELRDEVVKLNRTIEKSIKETDRLSQKIYWLNWIMVLIGITTLLQAVL